MAGRPDEGAETDRRGEDVWDDRRRRTESRLVRELGVDSYVRISDVSKATEVMWKLVGKKEKKMDGNNERQG